MSQGPTDENLKKARERVMQLAREIEGLSREPIPPNEFFPQFLDRVVAAVGAQAGAVWLLHEQSIALAAEVRLAEVGLNEPGVRQINDQVLGNVLSTGEACTLSHDDGTDTKLPTHHMLVLCAVHKEKKCVGVVQLFQRPDAPEEARAGYLQFLEQMSGYASRYIEGKTRKNQETEEAPKGFWQDLEPFTLRLTQTLNSEEVAEIAASDGRLLLECDRLSIVTKKGAKVEVKSVSGQTSVNPRANLIRSMAELGKQVIAMGEPLMYSGRIDDLAPQIEKPLANFIQESTSRMVYMVPYFENLRVVKADKEVETGRKSNTRRQAIGCLVVEQVAESEPGPALVQRAELLADHIGASMHNARSHERIFGISVWRRIGRTLEWFHGRRLAIAAAIAAAIVLVSLALVFVPADFKIEAEGKLMPRKQIAIFSPEKGNVDQLLIKGGEEVEEGQTLLTFTSNDLDDMVRDAEAEYNVSLAEIERLTALIESYNAERKYDEAERYEGEKETARIRAEGAQKRLANAQKRASRLKVTADFGGLIPSINLRQTLGQNRPVEAGQHLFDLMDHKGAWHLEVQLPDKRMGHLMRAQAEAGEDGVEGEYSLASAPEDQYPCKLYLVSSRTSVHGESGTIVQLYIEPTGDIPEEHKRIGAEVRVKLNCGTKSLGYKWFGDVVEFYHKYTWW
jgi:hypothetical protein